jgi:hypothetical protein
LLYSRLGRHLKGRSKQDYVDEYPESKSNSLLASEV